ncbi:MAG: c-type cytochrome [Gemmatimonadales bacterium]
MRHQWLGAAVLVVATSISCASGSGSKPPAGTPAPGGGVARAPAPQPASAPPAGEQGGRMGGPPGWGGGRGGFGGRVRLTPEQRAARRDSLDAVRTATVQELMTKIAGSENRPAGEQFANVLLMKDSTSAALLRTMDYFGKSLSVGCSFCHTVGKWDDDSHESKRTARVMIEMVNMINTQALTKMPPNRRGETPTIDCVTCHRGNTGPGTALLP